MPTPPRYGALAQLFADVAEALPAFKAFGYGIQANIDVADSGQLPLLFMDALVDFRVQSGQKLYTVAFYCLDKSTDDHTLTYEGTTPTEHHLARVLSRMELAGEQVIARLAQLAENEEAFYVLPEPVAFTALPIAGEYNGKLTGWRFEITLESTALNSYCELGSQPVLVLVGFTGPSTSLSFDGSIDVLASEGTSPYTYTINGGSDNGTGEFTGLGEASFELQAVDSVSQASDVLTQALAAESDCGDTLDFTVENTGLSDGSYDIDLLDNAGNVFRAAIGTAVVSGGTATIDGLVLPCDDGGGGGQTFAQSVGNQSASGVTDANNSLGDTPSTFAVISATQSFITLDFGSVQPAGTEFTFELSIEEAVGPDAEYVLYYTTTAVGGGQGVLNLTDPVDPGTKIQRIYTLPTDTRYVGVATTPNTGVETIRVYRAWYGTSTPATPITTGRYELEAGGASLGELTINAQ